MWSSCDSIWGWFWAISAKSDWRVTAMGNSGSITSQVRDWEMSGRIATDFLVTSYLHVTHPNWSYCHAWHGVKGILPWGLRLVIYQGRNWGMWWLLSCFCWLYIGLLLGGYLFSLQLPSTWLIVSDRASFMWLCWDFSWYRFFPLLRLWLSGLNVTAVRSGMLIGFHVVICSRD